MNKGIVFAIVLLLLLPIAMKLLPKQLTMERIQEGLLEAGFIVENVVKADNPIYEADTEWGLVINGARTDVFFYSNEGVIAKQHEFQKKDAGSAIVEAWNLSESLGAAKNRSIPRFHGRNGKVMIVTTTPDKDLGKRIVETFRSL